MNTVSASNGRPGDQQWFDLLASIRECAADHVRIVATDALIAVEHDWMVNSFVSQSEFSTQSLSLLSQARNDLVDEIEARVRTRFEVMSMTSLPSMQSEMDRARVAKVARAACEAIEQAHGEEIEQFGERFIDCARAHVTMELSNPLDPAFMIDQVLEALAGIQLPHSMRQGVLQAFTRKWIGDIRSLLRDLNGHISRFEGKSRSLEDPGAAQASPTPTGSPSKIQFSRIQSGYDAFEWSTSLGAGNVIPDGPVLTPSQPGSGSHSESGEPTRKTAAILPFRRPVSREEAADALTQVQRRPPLRIRGAFDGIPEQLGERLKEELLSELRALHPGDTAPLSPRDEHAANSVGAMFQQAVGEEEIQERGKGALSRMVVPCLKAAVIDRTPFDESDHPARKLVSSLVEAIKDSDGHQARKELMSRAEEAVDRVVAEFNEDMAILTIIEQELRGFMQQWEMGAKGGPGDASEVKRTSEINATHALLERTAGVTLPYAVAEFMTGPWHRRLMRFGMMGLSGGDEWMDTLQVADRLLALWSVHPPTRRDAIATINGLSPKIDAIWLDDGAPSERAQQHRSQMITALDDVLRPEDIEQHERQMARMEAEMAQDPVNSDDLDFVQGLRVGDWVLLTGPDGTTRQVKLSWISPISDRRLFVSRQGVRVMVATQDELAALKHCGRLRTE